MMAFDLNIVLWIFACAAMLVAAMWNDATAQRIPNWAVLSGVIGALMLAVAPGGVGLSSSVTGLACGFAVMLPFYLIRVMGAGDVKLLAATGAFVGFPGVLVVILGTFIAGGVMSLFRAIQTGNVRAVFMNLRAGLVIGFAYMAAGVMPRAGDFPVSTARIPYAFAIAAGTVAYVLMSNKFALKNTFF